MKIIVEKIKAAMESHGMTASMLKECLLPSSVDSEVPLYDVRLRGEDFCRGGVTWSLLRMFSVSFSGPTHVRGSFELLACLCRTLKRFSSHSETYRTLGPVLQDLFSGCPEKCDSPHSHRQDTNLRSWEVFKVLALDLGLQLSEGDQQVRSPSLLVPILQATDVRLWLPFHRLFMLAADALHTHIFSVR